MIACKEPLSEKSSNSINCESMTAETTGIPPNANSAKPLDTNDLKKELQNVQSAESAASENHYSEMKRTDDIHIGSKNLTFEALGLKKELIKATVLAFDWKYPSPVQERVIPAALSGKNVVARAKNGTGKTGSFILPIMNNCDIEDKSTIEALIIVPNRELAMQTSSLFITLSKHLAYEKATSSSNHEANSDSTPPLDAKNIKDYAKTVLLTGGNPVSRDIILLKTHASTGVKFAVGTPGRILDLARQNILPMDALKFIVFDEADKLLSDSISISIRNILALTKPQTQIMMVSATFKSDVANAIQEFVPQPEFINLMPEIALKGITNYYCHVQECDKIRALNTMFCGIRVSQAIIFVRHYMRAEALNRELQKCGYSSTCIHSQMDMNARKRIFNDFKHRHSHRILVCTDIFERGIDNTRINVVVNFDLPRSSDQYLHRIGRAGRFGRRGIAISIVNKDQDEKLLYTKVMMELKITPLPVPKTFDESLYQNE